jgi:hypothetical protein
MDSFFIEFAWNLFDSKHLTRFTIEIHSNIAFKNLYTLQFFFISKRKLQNLFQLNDTSFSDSYINDASFINISFSKCRLMERRYKRTSMSRLRACLEQNIYNTQNSITENNN